jgi:hypothetical protein
MSVSADDAILVTKKGESKINEPGKVCSSFCPLGLILDSFYRNGEIDGEEGGGWVMLSTTNKMI